MTVDINGGTAGPFNTKIPLLSDNADIQTALRVYHYGSDTTNPSPLPSESIAGHLTTLTDNKVNIPVIISGAGTNLNNYITTGSYHQASTSNARSGTSNYPTAPDGYQYAGMLEVLVEGGVIYQTYTMADGINNKYWRIKFAGTWSAWKTSTDQITGSASTIATANVTANRALISGAGQKVEVSAVTSTELATLSGINTTGGVTIQDQFTTAASTTATNLTNGLATKPTQQIGYKDTGTTAIGGNTTKKIVIASPNSGGTAPNASGYTASEGDIWLW